MKASPTENDQGRTKTNERTVIDTAPALIHTGLPDGSLDFFNQRWLEYFGVRLEEIQGWRWTTVIHPEDVEGMVATWRAALASGEPFEAEARVRRADGQYRWFLHRKVPMRDERGGEPRVCRLRDGRDRTQTRRRGSTKKRGAMEGRFRELPEHVFHCGRGRNGDVSKRLRC